MKRGNWQILAIVISLILVTLLLATACAKPAPAPAPAPTPAPAPAQPIELKFASYAPPPPGGGSITNKMITPWGQKIGELTKGRVKITFYLGESLAKAAGLYEAVLAGTADIVWVDPGFTPGVFLREEVMALGMFFTSAEVGGAACWELIQKYMKDTDFKKVKILWVTAMHPSQVITKPKPVKTLEDLKGMKFAAQGPAVARVIGALGAAPVVMPQPEIYNALDRGLVDGNFNNLESYVVFKTVEVAKYLTVDLDLMANKTVTMMNLDSWNKLPPDIQKIIEENSGLEFSRHCGAIHDEQMKIDLALILDYYKKAGNPPPYNLPESERARWVQAVQPIIEAWVAEKEAKGIPGKAIAEDFRALIKKYSK